MHIIFNTYPSFKKIRKEKIEKEKREKKKHIIQFSYPLIYRIKKKKILIRSNFIMIFFINVMYTIYLTFLYNKKREKRE